MELSSRPKRNFGSFYSNRIVLAFFILSIFYTGWNLFVGSSNIFSLIALKSSDAPVEKLLKYEKERNKYLYAKEQQLKESPNYYMKKYAAEYMQMQKPDEKIIILPKNMWFNKKDERP